MGRRLLFASLFAYAAAACSNRYSGGQRPDLLIIATAEEPTSLNSLYLQGRTAQNVGELGYSYLTKYDRRGAIVPDVAEIVPTSANGGISRHGKRIVFHLRRNISWQDGSPLTARDVVFTYRSITNRSNTIPSRDGYDRIARVWAPDLYTVAVELTRPQAGFVAGFFGGESNYAILPAHLLATYPNLNHVGFNESPIGSGPYRFTKWIRGDRLDLT